MTLQNQENNAQLLRSRETLTLNTLINIFKKQGVADPEQEAKKYLLEQRNNLIEFYDIYP